MAQTWVPTRRKRLMLAMLDAIVKVVPSLSNRGANSGKGNTTDIKKILVVELWNIGDVVLTMPFLSQLRSLFPAARISLLARSHARTILEGTGLVDEVIETELGWTAMATRFNPLAYRWRELGRLRRELRAHDFDVAFKARAHVREHLVLGLSAARRRVAFAFGRGDAVLTDPIEVDDPHLQKSFDWLKLLEPFGGPMTSAA